MYIQGGHVFWPNDEVTDRIGTADIQDKANQYLEGRNTAGGISNQPDNDINQNDYYNPLKYLGLSNEFTHFWPKEFY